MITIVTHDGKFHADDVFAVATVLLTLPEETETRIIRTRDEEVIKSADYVVDVGQIYDPMRKRFDHHQIEGAGIRENGIPYASFGLVWKEFGDQISDSPDIKRKIDLGLVQSIDALDNGLDMVNSIFQGIRPLDVVDIVDTFRPTWNEDKNWDVRFKEVVIWAKMIILRLVQIEASKLEAGRVVEDIYHRSLNKEMIVIGEEFDFGREIVRSILAQYPEPIYAVLYRADAKNWQVVTIMKNPNTHESRKYLPELWRAKSGFELAEISGVSDAKFCHRSGFMALAESKEGAIQLARLALEAHS